MDTLPPTAAADPARAHPHAVSLPEALRFWLKLGFIGFGGPAGQIALMHGELVERRRWISERRFLHALNYCMLLPGPEAQQLATYLGWLLHRTWGGILAGVLFVLPSLFIMLALGWLYMAHGSAPAVAGVFYGIKPAVTALVAQAAVRLGSRSLRNGWLAAIAVAAFVALFAFDMPFPAIVVAAAVLGHAGGRWRPGAFGAGGGPAAAGHAGRAATDRGALIDDDTPAPPHAQFSWRRLRNVLAAGLGLWLLAMGGLCAVYGWNAVLVQMGWFFTKAALMTFGGAYAVLPYVYQGAVEHFHWITPAQMIDGLALGETTPGPLIMVVSFVAFVGGWTQALFGPDAPMLAGAAAAVVVTFFTFLPSFVFILLGGPFIESTHGNLRFTAPLSGITAAVVGVIVNLAVFFAWHVFWPHGLHGGIDVPSVLIGLAAAVALMRYRVGVIPVILAAGAAGFAFRL
ncbi:chromate efflux transporter [Acidovorax sp. GBBC 3334]|uniref:chromate efflux transporter n=1 Tax=Acidovorax sp. GBBC 3334 TaxID=2940496 RepID=UPI0023026C85|nr:chromate efflux transporter [Acidovorax sp. GBBC 3334]MDA8453896.1 chromate efflux transporter [Acidovorax sp. GBBC 3334]